jgi:aspartyl-tRNA(Asn)/glutamyl-tRNA(Gln) amidotransferase subunit A
MTDRPWAGDVVSLVDAFRRGERHPREEMVATLAAAASDDLNAICHVDPEAALVAAEVADVSLPFGGVPLAVKELLAVAGWPDTRASVALADLVAGADSIPVERLRVGGAIPTVQTTSSEFGGVNQTTTKLHGVTRNPWQPDRTPGGSSGGSAAGVAGRLFALASASDGGGSIRIPAGFCGLVGLKPTYGRVPKGPQIGNLTAVEGCVSRSVRDTARWLDVTNGIDRRDPFSLPRVDDYEARLGDGIGDLASLRVAVVVDLGCAVVAPETEEIVTAAAEELVAAMGSTRVEIDLRLPRIMGAWGLTGGIGIRKDLGDRWPDRADDLTGLMRASVRSAEERVDLAAMVKAETRRQELNVAMAEMFAEVDVVLAATNPSTAFDAEGRLPSVFGGRESNSGNNGALTAPSNIYGNAAISLPAGLASDGLPVGLQVVAPHHAERMLLDIGLLWERTRPWPLTVR